MHTEGPWKALPTHDAETIPYVESNSRRIATIATIQDHATTEDFDNARLIAAAPELLETLDGALQFIELVGMKVPEELKRVVAKAKGLST